MNRKKNSILYKLWRLLSVVAVMLLLAAAVPAVFLPPAAASAASSASMTIVPSTEELDIGDTFTVEVQIDTGSYSAYGVQCGITWSPAGRINCTGVEAGDFFKDYSPLYLNLDMEIDNDEGHFVAAADSAKPDELSPQPIGITALTEDVPSGEGTILIYTFEVVDYGKVTIDFDDYTDNNTEKPFNHIITECTDLDTEEVEPDLINATVIVGELPDLVVEEVSGAWEEGGTSYQITYTVTNQGVAEAGATTTAVYIDGDEIGIYDCPDLDVDESDTVTVGPFTVSGGDDDVEIVTDLDGEVVEADEENNSLEYTMSTLPDLVVQDISQEWEVTGESYLLTYTVNNQGANEAEASVTAVYIDDTEVITGECPALAAWASDTQTVGPFTLSDDRDDIKICADKEGAVDEADEENNCTTSLWTSGGAAQPDLIIDTLIAAWEDDGENFTISYKVKNQGDGDAAASTVVIKVNDEEVATGDFPALTAGNSDSQTAGPFAAGEEDEILIQVCADPGGAVAETDETNNCLEKTLEREESGDPDLVVLSKSEYWVVEGDTYNVTYTVTNQGLGNAAATTTVVLIDGEEMMDRKCPALAAGESDTVTVGPFTLSDEEDLVTVCVDAKDEVAESVESNNCREHTWSVSLLGGIPITRPPTPGITIAWEYLVGLVGLVFIAGLTGYVIAVR
jgi:subtilase family serine protease